MIKTLIAVLDELIALGEFYDSPSYHAAINTFAETLQAEGVAAFDDLHAPYDETRHDVHEYIKEGIDIPTVCHTFTRGYTHNGEVLIKSIVNVKI